MTATECRCSTLAGRKPAHCKAHPREQVSQDTLKQGNVRRQELRLVDIPDGSEHEQLLSHVAPLLLVSASSAQHADDCPHAVVVVRLTGQLF